MEHMMSKSFNVFHIYMALEKGYISHSMTIESVEAGLERARTEHPTVIRDAERYARFAPEEHPVIPEEHPVIPEGYSTPLEHTFTRLLINRRVSALKDDRIDVV
jgi:hypothetical protein